MTDIAICQSVWERLLSVLIWPTSRLRDPNNHIIWVGASSTRWNFKNITYGWNEVRRGQKRQEMNRPWQLSKPPWRCSITAQEAGLHLLVEKGFCAPESLLLPCSTPREVSQAKQPSWRRMQENQANTAFEIMKALTSCLCSSCELYCQARSSMRAAVSIVVGS